MAALAKPRPSLERASPVSRGFGSWPLANFQRSTVYLRLVLISTMIAA
jgi:hypothetical protein